MAITRLGHIKEAPRGNPNQGIKNCINYIFNPLKTENFKYIAGHNVVIFSQNRTESAYEQFLDTKRQYGKMRGRQAYHYKLSFAEGDNITAELALKITEEFCERYLGSYEAVYSVHTDTKHIHSHIVFNSVAFDTGLKYHYNKGDWKRYIQPIVNDICIKYKLSYIDMYAEPEKKYRTYAEWKKSNPREKKRSGTYYSWAHIRRDIDSCIANADNYDIFKNLMYDLGYKLDDTHKHLRIFAPGRKNVVRAYILTPDKSTYTIENIKKMITGDYKPIDREKVIEKMVKDFNVFLKTKRIDVVTKRHRSNIAFAQSEETVKMALDNDFKSASDVEEYLAYINQADKELNIIKKYVNYHVEKYNEYQERIEEIIALLPAVREYWHDNSHEEEYNKAVKLYVELKNEGVLADILYKNYKAAGRLAENITQFKKKLFVDKKIAQRILSSNTIDIINKQKKLNTGVNR